MENGNFAEAQLRALIDVAAVAAGAHRLEEVLELAAERSLAAVNGASLSISRWEADRGDVNQGAKLRLGKIPAFHGLSGDFSSSWRPI